MNADAIFAHFVDGQGWSLQSQVLVLLRYIDNQNSPEAFGDFLQDQADEENGADEFAAKWE